MARGALPRLLLAITCPPRRPRRSDIPDGTVTYRDMGGSEHPADAGICRGPCDWAAARPAMALCSRAPAACLAIGLSCEPATHVSRRLGGRGYRPAEENKSPDQPIGVIAIDSLFSPVTRVRYSVESARVGQRTDYDRLVLEIWTDGRISPDDALTQASAVLQHHLDVFVGYDKNAVEFEEVESKQDDDKSRMRKLLNMSVNEIELSVRAANCLNNANITTVGQLAMKTEAEMLKYRNFGKKSLNEIKEKLAALGLGLGMNIEAELLEAPKEEAKQLTE